MYAYAYNKYLRETDLNSSRALARRDRNEASSLGGNAPFCWDKSRVLYARGNVLAGERTREREIPNGNELFIERSRITSRACARARVCVCIRVCTVNSRSSVLFNRGHDVLSAIITREPRSRLLSAGEYGESGGGGRKSGKIAGCLWSLFT